MGPGSTFPQRVRPHPPRCTQDQGSASASPLWKAALGVSCFPQGWAELVPKGALCHTPQSRGISKPARLANLPGPGGCCAEGWTGHCVE